MDQTSRISVVLLRAILGAAKAYGFDTARLMDRAAVSISDLASDDLSIDRSRELAMLEAAYQESRDPDIAVRFGSLVVRGQFLGLEYLIRTSPTLNDSLRALVRFGGILRDVPIFEFVENDRKLIYRPGYALDCLGEQLAVEYAMAVLVSFGCEATGVDWKDCTLEFRHQRASTSPVGRANPSRLKRLGDAPANGVSSANRKTPSSPAESGAGSSPGEILGLPVLFGQDETSVVFPPEVLQTQMPEADSLLCRILSESASDHLARSARSNDLADAVCGAIVEALPECSPTLEYVSERVGLQPAELKARLRAEGQSFTQVLEDVRCSLAKQYLQEDARLSLFDVAVLLGYENVSAFHREFRRWTGVSPDEFRKRFGRNLPTV